MKWYLVLGLFSRGGILLGSLLLAMIVSTEDYGLYGIYIAGYAFVSQAFGYSGYFSNLRKESGESSQKYGNESIYFSIIVSVAGFFIYGLFYRELTESDIWLYVAATFSVLFGVMAQCVNGVMHARGMEKEAALYSGISLLIFMPIGILLTSSTGGIFIYIISLSAAYLLNSLLLIKKVKLKDRGARIIEFGDIKLFSEYFISGVVSGLSYVAITKDLYALDDKTQLGIFTYGMQARAIVVFFAGIYGAKLLKAYSGLRREGVLATELVFRDSAKALILGLAFLILGWGAYIIISAKYRIDIDVFPVLIMVLSGVILAAVVPFSRAINVMHSEHRNSIINLISTSVVIIVIVFVDGSARVGGILMVLNSLVTLFVSAGYFFGEKK